MEGSVLYAYLVNPWTMLVVGFLAHLLKKVQEERAVWMRDDGAGTAPTVWAYILKYPYQTMLAIIGSVVGVVAAGEFGTLNPLTAFSCGYMANSMVGVMDKRAESRVPKG